MTKFTETPTGRAILALLRIASGALLAAAAGMLIIVSMAAVVIGTTEIVRMIVNNSL